MFCIVGFLLNYGLPKRRDGEHILTLNYFSVQFSFISAPPHEQNNKMLKSLCVVKDGLEKGRSNKTS